MPLNASKNSPVFFLKVSMGQNFSTSMTRKKSLSGMALSFPVAFGLAESYGVAHMPFVMAVAFGASASFLTPYGYTTNLMVQNLGGYSFRDYLRAGLPMSIVYSICVIILIPVIFPFEVG